MPEFQQDFKLPTEKDWQNFLGKYYDSININI